MNQVKGLSVLGMAAVLALGVSMMASSVSFAEDAAKKEAPAKKEGGEGKARAGKNTPNPNANSPMGPVFSQWAKELGLDEATQTKLAAIHTKQEEANKPIGLKIAELTKAAEEDKAAGKADDAKTKQAEIMKLKAEQAKNASQARADAIALLSPEQQKKLVALSAFKQSNFRKVKLTPEQEKKVMDKLEASADSISNAQKDVDQKKANAVLKPLEDEVLTAEQKAELEKAREAMKAKGDARTRADGSKPEPTPVRKEAK
jgi:Spy/CpxP family protein refolding chaperone